MLIVKNVLRNSAIFICLCLSEGQSLTVVVTLFGKALISLHDCVGSSMYMNFRRINPPVGGYQVLSCYMVD